MTKDAFKYLQERLYSVRYGNNIRKCVDPPEIRALRKKLARHDLKQAKVLEDRHARRLQAISEAKEVLYRRDYDKAVAAIKRLEQMTF